MHLTKGLHLLVLGLIVVIVFNCKSEIRPDYHSENVNRVKSEKANKQLPSNERNYHYAGAPVRSRYPNIIITLTNIGYMVGYDESRKNPAWVAYRLFKVENPKTYKRPKWFSIDKRTEAKVSYKDYTRTGYDRGHMAPNYAICTRYGRKAQLETFLMSNIVPQKPKLNQQVWRELEMLIAKDYAKKFKEVWVITGPIYDDDIQTNRAGVEIPDKFYKIVLDEINQSSPLFLINSPFRA